MAIRSIMKVLLVHNFYQSSAPSGEDLVFVNERDLLRSRAVDVVTYERSNDELAGGIGAARAAVDVVWSRETYSELQALIRRERPDVVHFHNIWYRVSPAAYYACESEGVPVVQTIHNFRILCVNGLLLRHGKTCEDCLTGKNGWPGFVRGCFRSSPLYSFPVFLTQAVHRLRKTWGRQVDRYIALSDFGRRKLVEGGLPPDRFTVKPNFLPNAPRPDRESGDYAVFVGRLTEEKGIGLLLDSWKRSVGGAGTGTFGLKVIGEGTMRSELERCARSGGPGGSQGMPGPIEFTGQLPHDEVMKLVVKSRFLVLPSLCYEMFPLAVIEAFACGKPVIGSRGGAIGEIVGHGTTGLLFESGNCEDLARCLRVFAEDRELCQRLGAAARDEFESRYTAESNFSQIMAIYENVIDDRKRRKRGA